MWRRRLARPTNSQKYCPYCLYTVNVLRIDFSECPSPAKQAILQHDPVDRKRLARLKSLLCSEYCRVNILVNTDFSE
jgi:hypothetical protein